MVKRITSPQKGSPSKGPVEPLRGGLPAAKLKKEMAKKISVSVYPKDIARLDELKNFMGEQGIRNISDSEALRVACRCLVHSRRCVDVYREMQKEDGRRKEK